MCCIYSLVAFFGPRITIFLVWLFSNYLGRAYHTFFWPLLGFFFLPYTMLAYAVCMNEGGGIQGIWIAIFVLGVLADFGVIGGSAEARRRKRAAEFDENGLKRVN
jgi:hypothetical protein